MSQSKSNKRNSIRRSLTSGFERLQARELMAADLGGMAMDTPTDVSTSAEVSTANAVAPRAVLSLNADGELIISGSSSDYYHDDVLVTRDQNGANPLIVVRYITLDDAGNNVFENTEFFSEGQINSLRFVGKRGNDRFENLTGIPSVASGGNGNDTLIGGTAVDEFHGGAGNDHLIGDRGAIFGGANDFLYGDSGNDTIEGMGGNDFIDGSFGDDFIDGGEGNDFIKGDYNSLFTGSFFIGNDTLIGGFGNDTMYGGGGDDEMDGGHGQDRMYGDSGNDTMLGGDGNDLMYGGNGLDDMEGGIGNDTMEGGNGDDLMKGGDNNDVMRGGNGFDRMFAGEGNDFLDGGYDAFNDILHGGAGADVFIVHKSFFGANDQVVDEEAIDWVFTQWHLF